jgi:type I restriction enzyme S subunit
MSFSEWREVKLGEIINLNYGKGLSATKRNPGNIPVYSSAGITGWHDKALIKKNGIVVGRKGTVGTVYYSETPFYCIDTAYYLTEDDTKEDLKYLYYLLNHLPLKKLNTDSAVPGLNRDNAYSQVFSLPPIQEQKSIAHILSTLDEKIEVNNQINKTLENMAQAIFKQWFVDFEFPNEGGEPYKSSDGEMIESELGMIPKGWEVISLDKIVDVKSGYSYKGTDLSESNNAMVTIKNFDRNGGYKKDGLKEIIISDRVKKHHYIEINDVVVAHTDLTQGAEIIGNPVMVLSKGKYEKLIMSMDVVKVISKDNDIDNAFIYCLLKTDNFKQYALGYVNGTTVLHLSKKAIPQYKLPFPTDIKICKELSAILKTIMMKISLSDNENDNLNLTRDILLPKLMSGEIRVPLDEEGIVS